jgi:hypothetical protein
MASEIRLGTSASTANGWQEAIAFPSAASAHNHSGEQLGCFIVCHENGFRQGINS